MNQLYVKGRKEFIDFIKIINLNQIDVSGDARESLKCLIDVWKNLDTADISNIYLENVDEYDDVTNFIKRLKKYEISKCWYDHVEKITSGKINSADKKYAELNLAHIEFKLKFFENWDKLFDHELEMLSFFRKIEAISLLTKNSTYASRSLVDKLLINTQELPYVNLANCIEVKESLGKGLGVFATDDISENMVITFYPISGYADDGSDNYKISKSMSQVETYEDHCYVVDDMLKIIADPNLTTNTLLLGHMINDSVGNTFANPINSNSIKKGIYEYVQKSDNNCMIKVNKKYGLIYVVSTAYIYKGEELFLSYTPYYWFSRVSNDSELFYQVCSEGEMVEFLKNNVFDK